MRSGVRLQTESDERCCEVANSDEGACKKVPYASEEGIETVQ